MNLTKRTPSAVAAGDTWHLPPRLEATGPAATAGSGHPGKTRLVQYMSLGRNGVGQVGPAATGRGGQPWRGRWPTDRTCCARAPPVGLAATA